VTLDRPFSVGKPATRSRSRTTDSVELNLTLGRVAPVDYLGDPAAEAFFAVREHEAYYKSLHSVDERRDFHDCLKIQLVRGVEVIDERAEPIIDGILRRSFQDAQQLLGRTARLVDPVEAVRAEEAEGIRLLGVSGQLDYGTLRESYRSAALRYHPDRGGTNAEMTSINRAYELLHARLGEPHSDANMSLLVGATDEPPTTRDFVWSMTRLLLGVTLDDWDIDDATHWLARLTPTIHGDPSKALRESRTETNVSTDALEPSASGLVASYRFVYSGTRLDDDRIIDLIHPSAALAERLAACGDRDAAEKAVAVAETGFRRAKARGTHSNGPVRLRELRDIIDGQRKPRFTFNHIRQLDNALRFGAIDEKRYAARLKQLGEHHAASALSRTERQDILRTSTFAQDIPVDSTLSARSPGTSIVPHPVHYQTVESLSAEQQHEYLRAFGPMPSLELVEKYAWVRLSSLLRSAIYFTDRADVGALAKEATLIGKLQPRRAWQAQHTVMTLATLATLDERSRLLVVGELRLLLESGEPVLRRGRLHRRRLLGEMDPRLLAAATEMSERLRSTRAT
jgi:hypothetical protein